ncbi:unnamed protein product [Chironomus riparius]|uniref:Uncharacterized protein n=1 Tax=Chironomus riparius TaxID=315576 RepID=A0A9N9S4F8_9DIPT|nr:unnamed protein product [Chironomus riparius]
MQKKGTSIGKFFNNLYYDEFKWSVVKSISAFILGVRIAKEFVGTEVMPAIPL